MVLAGVSQCDGVYLCRAQPSGLADFAQSDLKLLWVVRPCLWLQLKVMRGSGVCFLFMAHCFSSLAP